MEKIVLVCREPENRAQLVAMIEDLFPECTLEVVARTEDDPSPHELSCRERRGVL